MQRDLFGKLKEEILSKFRSECIDAPSTDVALFGFNEYEDTNNSIRAYISNNIFVKQYLDELNEGVSPKKRVHINGKYLYNKIKDWDNGLYDIKIDNFYQNVFLRYLDYPSLTIFEQNYFSQRKYTKYACFFYSFRYHQVRDFTIEIDFEQKVIKQKGIHVYDRKKEYSGTIIHSGSCIDARLGSDKGDSISMLAYVGETNPSDMKIISAVFLFKASEGFPMTVEALMYRIDENDKISDKELFSLASRYLQLKRNNFRVSPEIHRDLYTFKVKGNKVSQISNMIGTYRIWSYDNKLNIVQTKFIINPDYTSYLFTSYDDNEEKKQTCLLNISTVIRPTLCISTHPEVGMGLINYAMVDIASANDSIIEGVFCTVGIKGTNHNRSARPIILLREAETREFDPEIIEPKSIGTYIDSDIKLSLMKARLDDLYNHK